MSRRKPDVMTPGTMQRFLQRRARVNRADAPTGVSEEHKAQLAYAAIMDYFRDARVCLATARVAIALVQAELDEARIEDGVSWME